MQKLKFLTKQEVRTIINKIGVKKRHHPMRDRAVFEVLWSTGLRVAELCALPDAPFISAKSDTLELSVVGKGNWRRVIFFSPACLKAIKAYLEVRKPSDSLLLFDLNVRAVQVMIKRRGVKAGFEGLHPHTLRHSFATHLLKSGMNVRMVQEFMGHKSITSTQVYTHVTNAELYNTHKKLYK